MHRLLAPVAAVLGALLVVISAPAVANAATLTATNAEPAIVDASQVTRALPISSSGTVGSVAISIDLQQRVSRQCDAPASGSTTAYYDMEFLLTSPAGTTVTLIRSSGQGNGGYGIGPEIPRQVVTLRDDAASLVGSTNGAAPQTGAFRPAQALSAFTGQPAGGTWTLTVADRIGSYPLCYFGATLEVVEAVPVLVAGDLPRGAEGVAYAGQLPAATAPGAVTYAATNPAALPPGLALAPTGAITGTPTTSGTYAFAVTASDAIGTSQPRTYTIVVEGAPSIVGPTSANATVGMPFTYAPTVDDGELATTITADGLPNGLTVNPTTGIISGTPADVVRSNYGVVLTATNARGSDEHSVVIRLAAGPVASLTLAPQGERVAVGDTVDFTVTAADAGGNAVPADGVALTSTGAGDVVTGLSVTFGSAGDRTVTATHGATGVTTTATASVLPAPVLAGTTLPVARVGVAYDETLPAAVAEGDDVSYAVAAGALPAGIALAADGTLSGTPTAYGVFTVAVTATDEFGTSEPADFVLEVQAPPVITGLATATATRDVPFSYEPALDAGQPAATVVATGLPDGVVVDQATGALSGTPTDAPGTYVVTLTATNVAGTSSHDVTITLAPGAIAALTVTPSADRVSQGGTVTFEVTAVDAGGYATPAAGEVTLSTGVEGDEVDGDEIAFGAPGIRTVTATAASTGATGTATVEVIAPPTLPAGELPNGIVGHAYAATLPAPTATGDATFAVVDAADLPDGVVVDEAGALSGTPTDAGTFVFAATVTDEFGTSEATEFVIVVQERASITGEATATAPIGAAFAYEPELAPGDPAATVSTREALPEWLSLDAATGVLSGTPTGALGELVVTLVADNGLGASEHEVTIEVVPGAVVALELAPPQSTVDQGGAVDFTVTGADVEGNAVDVTGDVELSSDVTTDVVDGMRVAFPTASPHTITATHVPTGVTATAVVEVVPAPTVAQPTPSAPGVTAPAPAPVAADSGLPVTGADAGTGWMLMALAAMLLIVGVVLGLRRRA